MFVSLHLAVAIQTLSILSVKCILQKAAAELVSADKTIVETQYMSKDCTNCCGPVAPKVTSDGC